MQYNFLNLPTSIGAMSLTYDATGRKWKKDGEFGAVLYDGGIEYRDGCIFWTKFTHQFRMKFTHQFRTKFTHPWEPA
ncbi:MAG: hypothetical protein H6566_23595 [Lewinellaceae bacterium]|nr:hypothetical protein [Lewinellaceae bacterium]